MNSFKTKAIFLDRDGVINRERGDYTYLIEDFDILPTVIETLQALKSYGYKLIVVTNQAGISKGLYAREDMIICHQYFQQKSGNLIDQFYFSPWHPTASESLARKPDSLLFERAIAKFKIDTQMSLMVGDKERDLIPARKLGIRTVIQSSSPSGYADHQIDQLSGLLSII